MKIAEMASYNILRRAIMNMAFVCTAMHSVVKNLCKNIGKKPRLSETLH